MQTSPIKTSDLLNLECLEQCKQMLKSHQDMAVILTGMLKTHWKDQDLLMKVHDNLQSTKLLIGKYEDEIKDRSSRLPS